MRVAVVTESYLPALNGVTNSVLQAVCQLATRGHDTLVIAPEYEGSPRRDQFHPSTGAEVDVVRVRSATAPGTQGFRVGLPGPRVELALRAFGPDVVHLASPFLLGAQGVRVARRIGVASVAVFQTDVAAFLARYGVRGASPPVWAWLRQVHNGATLTLAPSPSTAAALLARGFDNVGVWPRGVDVALFGPQHRCNAVRESWDVRPGESAVGYVGRLAPEKCLDQLEAVHALPGVRLVLVGDGPAGAHLRRRLPHAVFTGQLSGLALAQAHASLDVFVHPGPHETFCQSAQEAMASGVPIVAVNSGGVRDLVVAGRTGMLVEPYDGAALADAVVDLLASPLRRAAFAAHARRLAGKRSWSSVVEELLGHYDAAVTRHRAGGRHLDQRGGRAA